MKHSLTNKDTAALVGDCSVCGTGVAIVKVGNGHGCRLAVRQAKRNYKTAHPDRARAGRAHNPSNHRLTVKTGEMDNCAMCGDVQPVPWGRGWMCPTIIKERGWTVTQVAPTPKCKLCSQRFLIDGLCPKCDAEPEDLTEGLDPAFLAEVYGAGMHIETAASWLETDTTSAVPGWKTIGSSNPVVKNGAGFTIRPEYAALYGSGSR